MRRAGPQRGRGDGRRFGRGDGFRRGGPPGRRRGGFQGRGRAGPGARGGQKVVVDPHPVFKGVFVMRAKDGDALLTRNMVPGVSVYNEKRVTVEVCVSRKS